MVDTRFATCLHLMIALADREGELMTSEELALGIRTHATFVRKLLVSLAKAELIRSVRGKAGGVTLARCPKEISLNEIYDAVSERSLMATPNKQPLRECRVSCSMKGILEEVSNGIEEQTRQYLRKIRLSDIVKKIAG